MRSLCISLVCSFLFSTLSFAQSIDTVYFDNNWKGVDYNVFASYYRVYINDASQQVKRYRTFYINGSLQADGFFITMDRADDSKTVLSGENTTYFQNGKIKSVINYASGILEGDYRTYYEDGEPCIIASLKNGKWDGAYTEFYKNGNIKTNCIFEQGNITGDLYRFTENGDFELIEYVNGNPKNDYYYRGSSSGQTSKYKILDDTIYWEQLSYNDVKTFYEKGVLWHYYLQNGLSIAVTCNPVREYGNFHKVYLTINNDSLEHILFDPSLISARSPESDLYVWSYAEYDKRVRKRQNTALALNSALEVLNNLDAGKTVTTSNTSQNYSGVEVNVGVGASAGAVVGDVVGTHGAAVGGAVGASLSGHIGATAYAGNVSSSTTTVSYNSLAAAQQMALANERIAQMSNENKNIRLSIKEGYLEKTTIFPGSSVSGFIHVSRTKSDTDLEVVVELCECPYIFYPYHIEEEYKTLHKEEEEVTTNKYDNILTEQQLVDYLYRKIDSSDSNEKLIAIKKDIEALVLEQRLSKEAAVSMYKEISNALK